MKLSPKPQNAHEQPFKAINGSAPEFVIEEAKQKPGRPENERASLGEFTKNQRDLDSALEQPANRDKMKSALNNIYKVLVQEYKGIQ